MMPIQYGWQDFKKELEINECLQSDISKEADIYEEITKAAKMAKGEMYKEVKGPSEKEFDYNNRKDRCIKYARIFPYYRKVNCAINQLAKKFENDVVHQRRTAHAQALNIEELEATHRFFLAPYKSDNVGVFSQMYLAYLPPDRRLIYIGVDHSICRSSMSVLHEMGHFLGIRNRSKRLDEYFLPLISHALCFIIYNDICAELSHVPVAKKNVINYKNQNLIPSDALTTAEQARVYMVGYRDALLGELQAYTKKNIEQVAENLRNAKDSLPHCLKGLNTAKTMGFFYNIRGIVLSGLVSILNDKLQRLNIESDTLEFKPQLVKAIQKRINEIENAKMEGNVPEWYQTREEQLEETIADVFMMKISQASVAEFINNLVFQYRIVDEMDSVPFSNGSLLPRAIGICMAAKATRKDFFRWYDRIVELIPISFPLKKQYEIRKKLYRCYCEAKEERYSKTYKIIIQYANEIWNSNEYKEFSENNQPLLHEIQKILCRPQPLSAVLHVFMPQCR